MRPKKGPPFMPKKGSFQNGGNTSYPSFLYTSIYKFWTLSDLHLLGQEKGILSKPENELNIYSVLPWLYVLTISSILPLTSSVIFIFHSHNAKVSHVQPMLHGLE